MSRRASFASADLARALKGVAKAGMKVRRAEIENGKIVIVLDPGNVEDADLMPLNDWRARHGARSD
jgi:hypothetical protein